MRKNMTKKVVTILSGIIMALSVVACGNTTNNTSASNDAAAVESSVSETTGSTEVAEEAVVSEEGDTQSAPEETASDGPAAISNITAVADVPLITLNNGVQVPQLGLGTQIQRLEQDASEEGRKLLNDTSHDAVVAALQAGYRHLDTAHGYFNESGVGQGIIDSGVPREEIWVTSKL